MNYEFVTSFAQNLVAFTPQVQPTPFINLFRFCQDSKGLKFKHTTITFRFTVMSTWKSYKISGTI